MNDILPDEVHVWQFLEQAVRAWLAAYGYRELRMREAFKLQGTPLKVEFRSGRNPYV